MSLAASLSSETATIVTLNELNYNKKKRYLFDICN